MDDGGAEFVSVLDRREDLLRELLDGPADKPGLEATLAVSRSTIDRGVRELEDCGLIERCEGGFRLTLVGRLALGAYDQFVERVAALTEARAMLATVAPDAEFDLAMLDGGRVVEADRASPHRPLEALYGLVGSATAVRGFAPAIHPRQVDTYDERIAEHGMETELVLTDDVLERMATEYSEHFEGLFETDLVRVWRTGRELPFSLTVAETPDGSSAAVMVYGDRGVIGCILNDAARAVEWAEARFERERELAERVA